MRSPSRTVLFLLAFGALTGAAQADKIIMKNGKIYEGRIMGETARSVLIRPANPDIKPLFINMREVQTIVRESHGPETISPEAGRFAGIELLVTGNSFATRPLDLGWAPGVTLNGGFRIHPALELGVGLNWWPGLSGDVAVQDTQSHNVREYESFYAYSGGFHAKVFPFFNQSLGRLEPYIVGGYHWNRLTPKGSGDYFSGTSWFTGVGVSWRWTRAVALETRVIYQRITFDTLKFQSGEGDLSGVHQQGVSIGTGLAYRFL
jgi:hypothetical protein